MPSGKIQWQSGEECDDAYLCSITLEVMADPVIAADGHTYERHAIEDWFGSCGEGETRSPKTNAILPNRALIPNHALKSLIAAYRERTP
jgi:hypothetical protein